MSKRISTFGAPRVSGPTPEDWIEVLTCPTTSPIVGGRFYGVGRNASYKSCETGDLPAYKIGAQWRVPTEPLLQKVGLISQEARGAALRRALDALEAQQSMQGATMSAAAA